MTAKHFINDRWVETDHATLPVFDLSVLRGFGIFDFFRTYNGIPFHIDDHLERLEKSADLMGITIPLPLEIIKERALEGITLNGFAETGVRIVVTGGVSDDFITPGKPSIIIIFKPVKTPPAELYTHGGKAITWPTYRTLPEAKTLNYSEAVRATQAAHRQDALEAIYVHPETQEFYEGTVSNFFAVQGDVLLTPPAGILKGITRKFVMELAKNLEIECKEQSLYVHDIPSFQEVFITGSSKQVLPIVQIDEITIGNGTVGPISQKLKQAFEDSIHSLTH
jgi:branched-chain amino acid aminotransferase